MAHMHDGKGDALGWDARDSPTIEVEAVKERAEVAHFIGLAFKRRLGCFGWDQEKEPKQLNTTDNYTQERKTQEYVKRKEKENEATEDRYLWLRCNQPFEATWSSGLSAFTLDELMSATSNFSTANILGDSNRANILRHHGFGHGHPGVYKSFVHNLMPRRVVVIDLGLSYDKTKHWVGEAMYLETKKHPNLVKLLGFCNEYPHKLLVYEYIPSGSLQYYLVNNLLGRMSWLKRLKIAIGAAKGLTFLYEADTPMNYFGEFKASKIMIYSDYTAKLSGFVLPNIMDYWDDVQDLDVYNFGVVLLELLTGRASIDKQRRGRENLRVSEMLPHLGSMDELKRIMDPSLMGRYPMRAAWNTATIARRCCDRSARNRPSMREILDDLENIVDTKRSKQAGWTGKERAKTKQPDQAKAVTLLRST